MLDTISYGWPISMIHIDGMWCQIEKEKERNHEWGVWVAPRCYWRAGRCQVELGLIRSGFVDTGFVQLSTHRHPPARFFFPATLRLSHSPFSIPHFSIFLSTSTSHNIPQLQPKIVYPIQRLRLAQKIPVSTQTPVSASPGSSLLHPKNAPST